MVCPTKPGKFWFFVRLYVENLTVSRWRRKLISEGWQAAVAVSEHAAAPLMFRVNGRLNL